MVTRIEQRYIDQHPKCAELYATSRGLFPNGVTHDSRNLKPFPYFVDRAMAAHKWDVDGNDIIDYKTGRHARFDAARNSCGSAGVVPANGLLYTFPHGCGCYAMMRGFMGLASQDVSPHDDAARLTCLTSGPATTSATA